MTYKTDTLAGLRASDAFAFQIASIDPLRIRHERHHRSLAIRQTNGLRASTSAVERGIKLARLRLQRLECEFWGNRDSSIAVPLYRLDESASVVRVELKTEGECFVHDRNAAIGEV